VLGGSPRVRFVRRFKLSTYRPRQGTGSRPRSGDGSATAWAIALSDIFHAESGKCGSPGTGETFLSVNSDGAGMIPLLLSSASAANTARNRPPSSRHGTAPLRRPAGNNQGCSPGYCGRGHPTWRARPRSEIERDPAMGWIGKRTLDRARVVGRGRICRSRPRGSPAGRGVRSASIVHRYN
jgi:hypothetical protein